MNKKNVCLLVSGIILYFTGFVWFGIIGNILMMIGGVLLGIFLFGIGTKLRDKRKVLGNAIRIYGIVFASFVILVVSVAILSELIS